MVVDKQTLKDHLMQLDREFDQKTAETGVDGWVSYFTENGVMIPGPIIRGHEEIRSAMAALSRPDFSLRWEPLDADVSEDGTMGFTYGKYVRNSKDKDGNDVSATGMYTSIWKKQADGSWKIVLDMGN